MSKCFWEISPQYVDTTLYHVVNQVKNDRKEVNFEFYGATDHESINLIVRDQGQGIALEPQEKIGLPFFTTKKNGTGLGLSMSLSILERHNAKMDFSSSEYGTTFFINFPIVE